MESSHDPVRHLKYLRQSLSQDNKPIGFFISAGCPLSVEIEGTNSPLIPGVKGLSEYINEELELREDEKREDEKSDVLFSELEKAEKDKDNVEHVLTFIRGLLEVAKGGEVRGLSETDLEKLERLICEKIVSKLNVELPNQDTPYHRLGKWIKSINRELPIELFTTNYDLLMEKALDDLEIPYFDGFVGSRKSFFDLRAVEDDLIPIHWSRLWKIHGSINWYQETKDDKKYIYRSSEVKKNETCLIYPSHLKYDESRKMPYLALIDRLNKFIRKKSSFLILCGYSFNDNHLNDTIINALNANPTGMVLGLMHGKYDKNNGGESEPSYPKAYKKAQEQPNLNIWTRDKAIIGTNEGVWEKNGSEEEDPLLLNFIKTENNEKEKNSACVKLGDFSIFTKFLQNIIIGETMEN